MINHNKIVWPFEVPPVCTNEWDNDSWVRWIMGFSPKDYKGGATDKKAWDEFKEVKRVESYNRLLRGGTIKCGSYHCRGGHIWIKGTNGPKLNCIDCGSGLSKEFIQRKQLEEKEQ